MGGTRRIKGAKLKKMSRARNEGFASDYEIGLILYRINLLPTMRDRQVNKLIEEIIKKVEKK